MLIGAILAGGARLSLEIVGHGIRFASAPVTGRLTSSPSDVLDGSLSPPELLRGEWTTSGGAWSSEILEVKDSELEVAMEPREPSTSAAMAPGESDAELCELLSQVLPSRHQRGDVTVFSRNLPDLKMRAFLTDGGHGPRVVGGCVAYPTDAGVWTVVRLSRSGHTGGARETSCLLPGLSESNRLCARWSEEGQLQAELVAVAAGTWPSLEDSLKRAGWRVERPMSANRHSEVCLCRRDDAVISVVVRHRPWVQRDTLILVRLDRITAAGAQAVEPSTRDRSLEYERSHS